jgi:hypothetical protein
MAQQQTNNAARHSHDLNQREKRMLDIATGEVEDRAPAPDEEGKDPAASVVRGSELYAEQCILRRAITGQRERKQ